MTSGFVTVEAEAGFPFLVARDLMRLPAPTDRPAIHHAFLTKWKRPPPAGEMWDFRARDADGTRARAALRQVERGLGLRPGSLVVAHQVHGTRVHRVTTRADMQPFVVDADALITDRPGVALGVLTADCLPIALVDAKHGAVGIVHAGRRGTACDVAGEAVRAMARAFGARPDRLRAAIGPGIAPCCYDVGDDVIAPYRDGRPALARALTQGPDGRWRIDLAAANRALLIDAGVPPEQIAVAALCTRCHADRFHSYRVEGPGTGLQVSLVSLSTAPGEKNR